NDHVRLLRAGGRQHIGVGAVAHISTDIERIAHGADVIGRGIDQGNVVMFGGQPLDDAVADLTRPANDDPHRTPCPAAAISLPQTPRDFSFRCSAERSIPMNSAVREMFPPKRLIWASRYSFSNSSRASLRGKAMMCWSDCVGRRGITSPI